MTDERIEGMKDTTNVFWVAVIVILTILIVIITQPIVTQQELRENISKELCKNITLIYQSYDPSTKEIVCLTNVTYEFDTFNITPEQLSVRVKPDWGYYLNNTKGDADGR